jgi:hypothetical protein
MDLVFCEEGVRRRPENFRVYSDNEFLKLTIMENAEINLGVLKQLYRLMKNNGQMKPTVILLEPKMKIGHEAREYIHKLNKRFPAPPIAVITETFNERLMANFYKNFYKMETPYRIFKQESEAREWLQKVEK